MFAPDSCGGNKRRIVFVLQDNGVRDGLTGQAGPTLGESDGEDIPFPRAVIVPPNTGLNQSSLRIGALLPCGLKPTFKGLLILEKLSNSTCMILGMQFGLCPEPGTFGGSFLSIDATLRSIESIQKGDTVPLDSSDHLSFSKMSAAVW